MLRFALLCVILTLTISTTTPIQANNLLYSNWKYYNPHIDPISFLQQEIYCNKSNPCKSNQFCYFFDGLCGTGQGLCRPIPDICYTRYDPVCGCDLFNYPNECEANRRNISVLYRGTCNQVNTCQSHTDCNDNSFCRFLNNTCKGIGICTGRPDFCTMIYQPVCGCDHKTYGNPCLAYGRNVSIAFYGECEDATCYKNEDCPQINMYCMMPVGMCSEREESEDIDDVGRRVIKGSCVVVPEFCAELYDPVCGCDGKEYVNECYARAGFMNIKRKGACYL